MEINMTVKELMNHLANVPGDAQVILHAYDNWDGLAAPVDEVRYELSYDWLSDYQQTAIKAEKHIVVLGGFGFVEGDDL